MFSSRVLKMPDGSKPTIPAMAKRRAGIHNRPARQRIRRGVLRSIADLQAAINVYLAEHNASPKPFVWTKCAEAILAKLDRCPVLSV
jgi:hypothetical protein